VAGLDERAVPERGGRDGAGVMMSVKTDRSGRRTVELAVEVPGTPEQVWHAIATAEGISSWFMPTDVDEREGGAIAFHIAPGMDSHGHVTAWEPPRRFAYEEREWAPEAPPLATEFTVEARAGGTCVVRLVHSLFASGDAWDDQLESFESGWPSYFEVLRLTLRHFAGQRCSTIRVMGTGAGSEADTWASLTSELGLADAAKGQRRGTQGAGVPRLEGVVERVHEGAPYEVLMKLDTPVRGAGLFGVYNWGERVHVMITLFLFGDDSAAVAARDEPLWRAWVERTSFAPRHDGLVL
jgi:uncharacterized protein YndB with AHSA1/START domain